MLVVNAYCVLPAVLDALLQPRSAPTWLLMGPRPPESCAWRAYTPALARLWRRTRQEPEAVLAGVALPEWTPSEQLQPGEVLFGQREFVASRLPLSLALCGYRGPRRHDLPILRCGRAVCERVCVCV